MILSIAIIVLLAAAAVWAWICCIPAYLAWISHQPTHAITLCFLALCVSGQIGIAFGISNLFWHDEWLVQFIAGAALTGYCILLWWLCFITEGTPEYFQAQAGKSLSRLRLPRPRNVSLTASIESRGAQQFVIALFVPLGLSLVAAVAMKAVMNAPLSDDDVPYVAFIFLPIGAWSMFLLAQIFCFRRQFWMRNSQRIPQWIALAFILLMTLIVGRFQLGTAVLALVLTLSTLSVVIAVTHGRILSRFVAAIVAIIAIVWANSGTQPKFSFPTMEHIAVNDDPWETKPARLPGKESPVRQLILATDLTEYFPKIKLKPDIWTAELDEDERRILTEQPDDASARRAALAVGTNGARRFDHGDYDGAIVRYDACLEWYKAVSNKPDSSFHTFILQGRGIAQAYKTVVSFIEFKAANPQWIESDEGTRAGIAVLAGFDQASSDLERTAILTVDAANNLSDDAAVLRAKQLSAVTAGLYLRAVLKRQIFDSKGATEDIVLALKYNPYFPELRVFISKFFEEVGRMKYAKEVLDKAISSKRPENYPLYLARAELQARLGQIQKAISDDTEAIRLNGSFVQAYEHRAECYQVLALHERAARDLYRASRLRQDVVGQISESATTTRLTSSGLSTTEVRSLVNDQKALENWRENHKEKMPKLVVVATSGGGITAAYWTAKCLEDMQQQFPEFPRHVRIITGASGGMLGAGVYVKRLSTGKGNAAEDVGKDGLTPVVRQMLLGDLPALFSWNPTKQDRGRALETAWQQNTGETEAPFADLSEDEERGAVPSLIISPMLVEDGRFLLISNLDIPMLGGGVQFFPRFPDTRNHLPLGTAIRMNASFPYVSPAVELPMKPGRRVVDAGYLDNYGVWLATAWLDRHWAWILQNTSGVALIQLRAYPLESQITEPQNQIGKALEFLTTPIEGLSASRLSTMHGRNLERIADMEMLLNDDDDLPFFKTFVIECKESTALGWSMTGADRAKLDGQVKQCSSKISEILKFCRD